MSGSDRCVILALGGCLALAALGLCDREQQQKPAMYCEDSARHRDCRSQQYAFVRSGVPDLVERAISNPDPNSGQDHEKRDLAAQEASAVWAFWVAVFSGFGTLITGIGTIFLYRQIVLTRQAVEDTGRATDAMREANEISLLALKADHRPDVVIKPLGPYLEQDTVLNPPGATLDNVVLHDVPIFCPIQITNNGTRQIRLLAIQLLVIDSHANDPGDTEVFFALEPGEDITLVAQRRPFVKDAEAAANDAAYRWPIGHLMAGTFQQRSKIWTERPAVFGHVMFEDVLGIVRMRHFAFRPKQPQTCTDFDMWGGAQYNYEREVS